MCVSDSECDPTNIFPPTAKLQIKTPIIRTSMKVINDIILVIHCKSEINLRVLSTLEKRDLRISNH